LKLGGLSQCNFSLVKVTYEWAKGVDFKEVCQYTDALEGAIVRTFQRLDHTLKNLKKAVQIVGNLSLADKIE
jgi:antiviral helicase SKI2